MNMSDRGLSIPREDLTEVGIDTFAMCMVGEVSKSGYLYNKYMEGLIDYIVRNKAVIYPEGKEQETITKFKEFMGKLGWKVR